MKKNGMILFVTLVTLFVACFFRVTAHAEETNVEAQTDSTQTAEPDTQSDDEESTMSLWKIRR